MKDCISSRSNPFIKYLNALQRDSSFRRTEHAFVMEGVSLAGEALSSGMAMRLVVAEAHEQRPEMQPVLEEARQRRVEITTVTHEVMKGVSTLVTSPKVMAVVRMPQWSEGEMLKRGRPLLLLCGLQDPGNVGSIIRTAEAAGAGGIFCAPGTVDPFNPKVVRSSMGSILRVPVIGVDDVSGLLKRVRGVGCAVIATGAKAPETCFGADLRAPFLLLVGQEAAGVPRDLLTSADRTVSIPMEGEVESLNAAMATGIILFEAGRQRGAVE